ncbi:MAG: hypothetical protein JNL21_35280 [Myxococcales bacterium]|nr:hypothetical protein [Myxococcales bacterium]
MHAVVATSWGGPEVLEWQELPDLEPRAGEVRVRVEAAGVRVAGLSIVGGWAEQLLARADDLVRVPEEIESATAACLVMGGVGAWQMLHRVAEVRPGCRVLVHGATGGVGTAATQLARLAGAEVFGTARAGDEAVLEGHSIQRMRAAHPEWFKADLGTLLQMTAERIHRPHVSRTFALSEARLTVEALARGERGKFVLLA